MLLYRKKPNLSSQIHPTANSEFFKKNFINTKMIFVAKTAKWSLLLRLWSKKLKKNDTQLYSGNLAKGLTKVDIEF